MTGEKILFVDDEPAALDGYKRMLHLDYEVNLALGAEQGLATIRDRGPFAVVVSDMQMPGMNGAEFLAQVRETSPDSVRMLLTGYTEIDAAIQAINEGNIFRFLTKPCKKEVLELAISTGLSQYRLRAGELRRLAEATEQIKGLAFFDTLTGLPNRRMLLDRLSAAAQASAASRSFQALLFIDLDNFKQLNDRLGYPCGDLLLQEAGRRLGSAVSDNDVVARLGGDEFAVILGELGSDSENAAAEAMVAASHIADLIAEPYSLAGRHWRSSCSIGITVFGYPEETTEAVLQQAETAGFQAKATGRSGICFFSPELQAAAYARAALEEELRAGIEGDQFALYFQPQIDRGVAVGAEALVRWNHPIRGILAPGEFISLAEETGLILPLGDTILDAACRQIAAWAGNEELSRLTIAVNISAMQLRQPDFVERVFGAIDRAGADPTKIKLEITESMLVENIEDVISKMTELKSRGLRFSLDDFGTGYSSLAYLKRLPLNQLKIDRSFVLDIEEDATGGAIARSIISLSRALGLTVIAEGVETAEQREILAELGCHAYQGFLWSAPLPLEKFELFLLNAEKLRNSEENLAHPADPGLGQAASFSNT